jgi:hypothetical protein
MPHHAPLWTCASLLRIEQFLKQHPHTPVHTDTDGTDGLTVPEIITYVDWLRRKKIIGTSQWRIFRAKIEQQVQELEASI